MFDSKRIYELEQQLALTGGLWLVVDQEGLIEAKKISITQILQAIGHNPVTLAEPKNGLFLNNQQLGLSLAGNLSAGALAQLPQDRPSFKYINGENRWEYIYSNNTVGGHHSYATITERNAIHVDNRQWGMKCTIYNNVDDIFMNGTYELKYNRVDTNLSNNNNWERYDKMVVPILNQTEGSIANIPGNLSNPTMFVKQVQTNELFYKIVYPAYRYDADGTFRWSSSINIEDGYLLLI